MRTRRAFLVDVATFFTCGGLVAAGKKGVKEAAKKLEEPKSAEPENHPIVQNQTSLPVTIVEHAADFTLGGILGVAVKKIITQNIRLKGVNRERASILSKLQQLENTDLPGIEKILQEFVRSEGIRYEANNESNRVQSILRLLDVILVHVSSQSKATKPFLEELTRLREALAPHFVEQLKSGGDVNVATQEAVIQVLKSKELTNYLVGIVIQALESSGAGQKIGENTVKSFTKQDLVNEDGVIALRQTIVSVFQSNTFMEALAYAIGAEVTECDTGHRLVNALVRKFKDSTVQDNDPDLIALRNAFAQALGSEGVSEKLNTAVCNAVGDANVARELVSVLQRSLGKKS